MQEFNFSKTYDKADKEFNLDSGKKFKFKEGKNVFRLISVCLPHDSMYNGEPTFKWLCQVIDRADGKVKPFFMPGKIYKAIETLQLSERFSFDGVPMPYDIEVDAEGAGKITVVYTTLPGKESPLTSEELAAVKEAPTVQEVQQKVRDNEKPEDQIATEVVTEGEQPEPPNTEKEINVDDIPFG